jgi:hypothetical protein
MCGIILDAGINCCIMYDEEKRTEYADHVLLWHQAFYSLTFGRNCQIVNMQQEIDKTKHSREERN